MKNSTKLKIINWVKKVLKYNDLIIPTKEENRKIQEVQWEGILYEWDAKYDVKRIISNNIAEKLSELNMIDYQVIENKRGYGGGGYIVRARAFFIEPI